MTRARRVIKRHIVYDELESIFVGCSHTNHSFSLRVPVDSIPRDICQALLSDFFTILFAVGFGRFPVLDKLTCFVSTTMMRSCVTNCVRLRATGYSIRLPLVHFLVLERSVRITERAIIRSCGSFIFDKSASHMCFLGKKIAIFFSKHYDYQSS